MVMKVCTWCKVPQPLSEFYVRRKSPDGLSLICKTCSAAKNKALYAKKRDEIIAKATAWNAANGERRREIVRKSDAAHREEKRAKARVYRRAVFAAMPVQDRRALWSSNNRKFREKNPDRARQIVRDANRRAKERDPVGFNLKRLADRNRRRAKIGIPDKVDYQSILDRDGMWCHICNQPILERRDLHFDHVIPLAKGGPHAADNIRPSHARCNLAKGARIL